MKKKQPALPLLVLIAVLLFCSIYLYLESARWHDYSAGLESQNSQLNATLIRTQSQLANERALTASLQAKLQETSAALNETNNSLVACTGGLALEAELHENCTEENERLAGVLFEAREELENLSSELEGFQDQINSSMAWFTANSNIGNLSARTQYLIDHCTSSQEVNAACIPVVMKEEEEWSYKTEAGDSLLSLGEIVENSGGDCEDWSLFFKAAYNYLKYKDKPERGIISAVPGAGDFKIYNDWFYENADERTAGTTEDNVYVICYDSHCIVAISNETIENSSDVLKLEGAPAVEPQTGQYIFTIGRSGAPAICSDTTCEYSKDIWLIITDDDIYDFSYNEHWTGYKDYYQMTADYKERIDAIMQAIQEAE